MTTTMARCKQCRTEIVWSGPSDPWCDQCAALSLGPDSCVADLISERNTMRLTIDTEREINAALQQSQRNLLAIVLGDDETLPVAGLDITVRDHVAALRARCERLEAALANYVNHWTLVVAPKEFHEEAVAALAGEGK